MGLANQFGFDPVITSIIVHTITITIMILTYYFQNVAGTRSFGHYGK
jgi:phage shock protein PspC (stress-responsive transcriptional regulator)